MAKILVTGGTGFIGSRLVRKLTEQGHHVRVLARAGASLRALSNLPIEVCIGDILVESSVFRALAGVSQVYHVAAVYRHWAPTDREILEPAIAGTTSVLDAIQKRGTIERVVVTSSIAAVGFARDATVLDETSDWDLASTTAYVIAKRKAEQIALERSKNMPIVVVNPAGVMGPGDWKPTPSGDAILQFVRWDNPVMLFPGPPGGICVVDVDDVVEGHILAMQKGRIGQRYILGGQNLSFTDFYALLSELSGCARAGKPPSRSVAMIVGWVSERIAHVTGQDPHVTYAMAKHLFGRSMWYSSAKAQKELGFVARSARQTLSRALAWYCDNGYFEPELAAHIRVRLSTTTES
jgi:dihydroflavonol-4-reductase